MLERSWGVRFVSRTTHLVGLTLLGAEYAPFFRRIVQYGDEISCRADANSDKGGVLQRIGILKNRLGALPLDEPRFARATDYSIESSTFQSASIPIRFTTGCLFSSTTISLPGFLPGV